MYGGLCQLVSHLLVLKFFLTCIIWRKLSLNAEVIPPLPTHLTMFIVRLLHSKHTLSNNRKHFVVVSNLLLYYLSHSLVIIFTKMIMEGTGNVFSTEFFTRKHPFLI